mgnify:CR=1 FL=1
MNIEILGIAIPVITVIVNGIKAMGVPSKWAPLIAMAIGVGVVMLMTNAHSGQVILVGVVTGLASIGMYAGVKTAKEVVTGEYTS